MSCENQLFAYAKTKTQISFAVTAKLISAFVFVVRIVQSLFYLNLKFQASIHPVWLYSLVCFRPGWKPRRPVFSERGSHAIVMILIKVISPQTGPDCNLFQVIWFGFCYGLTSQYTIFQSCLDGGCRYRTPNLSLQSLRLYH